jgi:UDP-N-acetylmuramoylalanine--D-glutamate ligase
MEDAVNYAYSIGEKGDTVLLSPACASFDLYADYKERGKAFRNAVQNL